MSGGLHLVAVAFQFLTRLPVRVTGFAPSDLRRCLGAFPLVGLAVAGIGTGVRLVGGAVFSPAVATILAVLAMVAVTGAFHEDGLADAADGLWGGADAAGRLEIMRDSRLGTYGTVALVGALALRVGLLVDLPVADFARATVVGHVLGRSSTLVALGFGPPVTRGSAAGLSGGPTAGASTAAAAVVLVSLATALGWWGLLPLVVGLLATVGAVTFARRRLGGLSGDVLGATNQVVHLTSMAAAVAVLAG